MILLEDIFSKSLIYQTNLFQFISIIEIGMFRKRFSPNQRRHVLEWFLIFYSYIRLLSNKSNLYSIYLFKKASQTRFCQALLNKSIKLYVFNHIVLSENKKPMASFLYRHFVALLLFLYALV